MAETIVLDLCLHLCGSALPVRERAFEGPKRGGTPTRPWTQVVQLILSPFFSFPFLFLFFSLSFFLCPSSLGEVVAPPLLDTVWWHKMFDAFRSRISFFSHLRPLLMRYGKSVLTYMDNWELGNFFWLQCIQHNWELWKKSSQTGEK